jgi:soluble lytic murein transglycosylase-like protein
MIYLGQGSQRPIYKIASSKIAYTSAAGFVLALALIGSASASSPTAALSTPAPTSPSAASALAVLPTPTAGSLQTLSPQDAARYAQAFAAMRRGDFIAGENLSHGIGDPILTGWLDAIRLLHPAYRANYPELKAWLDVHGDLPTADRVYDLALKRRPFGAPAPKKPMSPPDDADIEAQASAQQVVASAEQRRAPPMARAANARQQAAREAFYKGDVEGAYGLASTSGERWIAGLAAIRLQRYDEALKPLSELAADPHQSSWVHSGAAYWAARAAVAVNQPAKAHEFLESAARARDTFYGLIATRELQQQAAKAALQGDAIGEVLAATAVNGEAVVQIAHTDPRARRAVALAQIGMLAEAGEELRWSLALAPPAERPKLTSLALALNAPLGGKADVAKSGWARFDLGHFPTPVLNPLGGFTIDKALVYALVNQESRFNANSVSASGAYGLMQLTAATAARLAGDKSLRHNPAPLRDPALNLRLGQDYVAKLLASVKGDVMRAVAAYNCGPGVIQKLTARMGQNADSLMMIESMPSSQTRDYVQRVMAGYWTYRQIFGLDSRTLDAAASDIKAVASADR